ncbi:MAG: hypothetical protein ACFFAN_10595 [Promethearchaeota archaeon]
MFNKKTKCNYKRAINIIALVVVLSINLSMFYLVVNQNSISTEKHEKIQLFLAQESDRSEWFIESHTEEWLENGDFEDDDEKWDSSEEGDTSDVDADISDGEANFIVKGDSGEFSLEVDPLDDIEMAKWNTAKNPQYKLYPHFHEINSSGFHISHKWNENEAQDENYAGVLWYRKVSMDFDMSDYKIISVSFEAIFNATVQARSVADGGIEVPGDVTVGESGSTQDETLDWARFKVEFSNLQNTTVFEVAHNQTIYLGDDDVVGPDDYINDTPMTNNVNNEVLKSYLTSVFNDDPQHKSFYIFLAIDVFCADNHYQFDVDYWKSLIIRSLNLTFSFEKKIDRLTTVSWEQEGDEISGRNIEITYAELNFEYKVDKDWDEDLSPNSEIRIFVSDEEYTETIKLTEAETSFEEASDDGFDVTDLISKNEDISVEIQVFLADEFGLVEDITVSIDEVYLEISYDVLIPPEQSFLFQVLFIIASVSATCIAGYLAYYQRVLKYPKPVRKVRKYRKSINKRNPPDISIISRERAFNEQYSSELGRTAVLLKGKLSEQRLTEDKIVKKPLGTLSKK